MTTVFHAWLYSRYRATSGERTLKRIKTWIFLKAVLAIEKMPEPQPNLEKKVNPIILKDDSSCRTGTSISTSKASVLLDRSNKNSWVFPALKSTKHFLSQSTVSRKSGSNSQNNYGREYYYQHRQQYSDNYIRKVIIVHELIPFLTPLGEQNII